jgi:hypothetical protein
MLVLMLVLMLTLLLHAKLLNLDPLSSHRYFAFSAAYLSSSATTPPPPPPPPALLPIAPFHCPSGGPY